MFSSVNSKILGKRALVYLFISLFLILFNSIYTIFSYGVHSSFMQFAFLIPLIGGSIVSIVMIPLPSPNTRTVTIWRMGLATLVIAFLLRGVFDIYGTSVAYIALYLYFGFGLLFCAFLLYIVMIACRAKNC